MKRGFEDEFMEIQSGLIALCLEAVPTEVEVVYAYAFIGKGSSMFNFFFEQQGKILPASQAIPDRDVVLQVLKIGAEDLEKLRATCKEYEAECPGEMKMYYSCKTKKYHADYQYRKESDEDENASPLEAFLDWRQEVKSICERSEQKE